MQTLLLNLSIKKCAKLVIRFCAFAIIMGLVIGCSPKLKKVSMPLIPLDSEDVISYPKKLPENQPILIRNSRNDKRPAWIHKAAFETGNNIIFTGGFQNGGDYSVTLRCANTEALKSVVQDISQFVRAEFSMFSKGSNQIDGGIDRFIQDGIATFSKNLHIQGIRQAESYYEEMWDPLSQATFYNVWVKLEINKPDYMKAKTGALRRLRDGFESAGEIEAKEKAQKLLDDLKGQISEAI